MSAVARIPGIEFLPILLDFPNGTFERKTRKYSKAIPFYLSSQNRGGVMKMITYLDLIIDLI
jgi:hypothetical protein